jgi:hypothetical protein
VLLQVDQKLRMHRPLSGLGAGAVYGGKDYLEGGEEMKQKAHHCEDCQHREWFPISFLRCKKGHKPRFYTPRNPHDGDFGWKRRCADFVETENKL